MKFFFRLESFTIYKMDFKVIYILVSSVMITNVNLTFVFTLVGDMVACDWLSFLKRKHKYDVMASYWSPYF